MFKLKNLKKIAFHICIDLQNVKGKFIEMNHWYSRQMIQNNLATLAKITKLIVPEDLNYHNFSMKHIALQK